MPCGCSPRSPCSCFFPIRSFVALFPIMRADGDPLGQFAVIQRGEGGWALIVKEPLDREAKDRYSLRVMATDGKFEAVAVVDVHVLDVNDNSPVCEQVRGSPPPRFRGLIHRWWTAACQKLCSLHAGLAK